MKGRPNKPGHTGWTKLRQMIETWYEQLSEGWEGAGLVAARDAVVVGSHGLPGARHGGEVHPDGVVCSRQRVSAQLSSAR